MRYWIQNKVQSGQVSLLVFTFFLLTAFPVDKTRTLYIAVNGNDNNEGTIEKPIATLEKALAIIREDKKHTAATIYFRGGYYPLNATVVVDSLITANKETSITAYEKEKVIISGGKKLDNSKFKKTTDKQMLQRLSDVAKGHVYETNLPEQCIQDYGNMQQHGFGKIRNSSLELFFNDIPLTIARWPNKDLLPVGKVLDHGSVPRNGDKENRGALFEYDFDRPSKWKNDDTWVYGIFANGYSDDNIPVESINTTSRTIKLKQASHYAVFSSQEENGKTNPYRGYYFYNVAEEIDEPGEWYLDRGSHKLYIWPPTAISEATITVSMIETPLLLLSHAANVSVRNITFGYCRGLAVYAAGTENINFEKCSFLNTGTKAVSLSDPIVPFKVMSGNKMTPPSTEGNKKFLINSCTIYNTGAGALTINGGNRKTLSLSRNKVVNCKIYNYARINRASPPAIILNGVGNMVTRCEISDGSSGAIGYSGNNHVISYNHISKVATGFSDIGAVYTGRDPSSTGSVIEYNFFDNITNKPEFAVAAVYIDDGSGGIITRGNIFYKCGNSPERGYGAVHINGGHNNNFLNNYFIDCGKAFSNTVWDDKKWSQYIADKAIQQRIRKEADIYSELYLSRYPFLKTYTDTSGTMKRNNYVYNSYLYNVGKFTSTQNSLVISNTFKSVDGKEISSIQQKNFQLKKEPLALKNAKGWKAIPFRDIGSSL